MSTELWLLVGTVAATIAMCIWGFFDLKKKLDDKYLTKPASHLDSY